MNVNEWKPLISAYVDGEGTAQEKLQAEKLIADRPECRAYLNELRAISKSLQTVKDEFITLLEDYIQKKYKIL